VGGIALVPLSPRRSLPLPPQPQQDLLHPRQIRSSRRASDEGFGFCAKPNHTVTKTVTYRNELLEGEEAEEREKGRRTRILETDEIGDTFPGRTRREGGRELG
jgi:hypothetical protein